MQAARLPGAAHPPTGRAMESPAASLERELGLLPAFAPVFRELKMTAATPIQRAAVPAALRGADVVGVAQTGTGKTAAYALPVLQRLARDPYGVFAVVLAPTKELAIQVHQQFLTFCAPFGWRDKVALVLGGAPLLPQAKALQRAPYVVVATPGRLSRLCAAPDGRAPFARLAAVVVDEADRLLAETLLDESLALLGRGGPLLPEDPPAALRRVQFLLFTATLTPAVTRFQRCVQSCKQRGVPFSREEFERAGRAGEEGKAHGGRGDLESGVRIEPETSTKMGLAEKRPGEAGKDTFVFFDGTGDGPKRKEKRRRDAPAGDESGGRLNSAADSCAPARGSKAAELRGSGDEGCAAADAAADPACNSAPAPGAAFSIFAKKRFVRDEKSRSSEEGVRSDTRGAAAGSAAAGSSVLLNVNEDGAPPSGLQQSYLFIPSGVRLAYLADLLENAFAEKLGIVFCKTCQTAQLVAVALRRLRMRATSLHALLEHRERVANLAAFRGEAARILVTTDVGARGLDIPAVEWVVNFDLPTSFESYAHRVGRTARMGRTGVAVSLVCEKDDFTVVAKVEKKMRFTLALCDLVDERRIPRQLRRVGVALVESERKLRDDGFIDKAKAVKLARVREKQEKDGKFDGGGSDGERSDPGDGTYAAPRAADKNGRDPQTIASGRRRTKKFGYAAVCQRAKRQKCG